MKTDSSFTSLLRAVVEKKTTMWFDTVCDELPHQIVVRISSPQEAELHRLLEFNPGAALDEIETLRREADALHDFVEIPRSDLLSNFVALALDPTKEAALLRLVAQAKQKLAREILDLEKKKNLVQAAAAVLSREVSDEG